MEIAEIRQNVLVTDGDEADGVSARPIRHPAPPVHVLRVMHIAYNLEFVSRVAPVPRVLEGIMPVR